MRSPSGSNRRSNTARGRISGGLGVEGVRQEMLLLYAQLYPLSQFPP
jgi:hypothetical protein